MQAPTGSGKTLAAFLVGIDRLHAEPGDGLAPPVRVAVEGAQLRHRAEPPRAAGGLRSELSVGVRTGDTPQRERQQMLRTPPDILITTPESLFLLLTSQGRSMLAGSRR